MLLAALESQGRGGWVGDALWLSVSQPKVGQAAWAQCQPGLLGPGAVLQGLQLSPVLSHGHVPGPLCHPVLCHLWILRAVDLGGREKGRRDLHAWILLPEKGTAGAMLYSSHSGVATTSGWVGM